jgi:hypothetical protein
MDRCGGVTLEEAAAGFARLGVLLSQVLVPSQVLIQAADRYQYLNQAQAVGLSREQALKILEEERAREDLHDWEDVLRSAESRAFYGPPEDGTSPEFEKLLDEVVGVSGVHRAYAREALIQASLVPRKQDK